MNANPEHGVDLTGLELVESGLGGGAQLVELLGKERGEGGKVRGHH